MLIFRTGNGSAKRSWASVPSRVTVSLPQSQSAIMAAPNFEEAAAIATEFISSVSWAQGSFLSGWLTQAHCRS